MAKYASRRIELRYKVKRDVQFQYNSREDVGEERPIEPNSLSDKTLAERIPYSSVQFDAISNSPIPFSSDRSPNVLLSSANAMDDEKTIPHSTSVQEMCLISVHPLVVKVDTEHTDVSTKTDTTQLGSRLQFLQQSSGAHSIEQIWRSSEAKTRSMKLLNVLPVVMVTTSSVKQNTTERTSNTYTTISKGKSATGADSQLTNTMLVTQLLINRHYLLPANIVVHRCMFKGKPTLKIESDRGEPKKVVNIPSAIDNSHTFFDDGYHLVNIIGFDPGGNRVEQRSFLTLHRNFCIQGVTLTRRNTVCINCLLCQ